MSVPYPYEKKMPGRIFLLMVMLGIGSFLVPCSVFSPKQSTPTTAYWNETKFAWIGDLSKKSYDYSDTRLIPGIVDASVYSFEVPERGDIKVTIKLIYRFAFYDLMIQKGWNRPDVLVTQKEWECKRIISDGFDCK